MKERIFTSIFIFLTIQICYSQSFNRSKLDSFFQVLDTNNKFMGSVSISQNGDLLYSKSIGYSDVATKTKANENSKYRIGSISKTFTAVLVFIAIEDNKFQLTTTLDKYFPTIINAEKITIGQLLSHRSGIHSFTNDPDYLTWNTQKKTEKELVEIIRKGGSDFKPDSTAEYSNSNYVLLSYILQKTYKKEFAEILKVKIIDPLGLVNTYFGKKINLGNNECSSYKFLGDWVKESETDMSVPLGAGAIVSTPYDLTKFAQALFNEKIISSTNLNIMKTIKDNYGMGLLQIPFYDKISYGHTGGIDGFSSFFGYFPDDKISFALTSNGTNYTQKGILMAILSSVYNKPYETPNFINYELITEELDIYIGIYSSTDIPIKITITKKNKTLVAQATGQSEFGLEATEKDKFKFDQAGVVLEFNSTEKQMILKQGGGTYLFTKE
ncbi:MAG: beta-lactamase family protein [Bacteroidota bacterium]|nr:beta-lactamase family protein [Bacteroidota bacterium]